MMRDYGGLSRGCLKSLCRRIGGGGGDVCEGCLGEGWEAGGEGNHTTRCLA